jgi:diacylglycerol kinase family enzyme
MSNQSPHVAAPPLAIVPFGTTNMSARTINTSRTRRRALQSLQQLLQRETGSTLPTRGHRLLQIENGDVHHFGFALGLGAVTDLVQEWQQHRSDAALLNRLRSMLTMVRGLRGADRGITLSMNDDPHNLYVLVVTTLSELIYGTRPFWGSAREPDADIRTVWIEAGTPDLLKSAPALLRGAPRMAGMKGYGSSAFTRLMLKFSGHWVLDGEVYDLRSDGLAISTHNTLRWVSL